MYIILIILGSISGVLVCECVITIPIKQIYIYKRMRRNGFKYRGITTDKLSKRAKRLFDRLIDKEITAGLIEGLISIGIIHVGVYIAGEIQERKVIMQIALIVALIITLLLRVWSMIKKLYAINTLSDILALEIIVHSITYSAREKGLYSSGADSSYNSVVSNLDYAYTISNEIKCKKDFDDSVQIEKALKNARAELDKLKDIIETNK